MSNFFGLRRRWVSPEMFPRFHPERAFDNKGANVMEQTNQVNKSENQDFPCFGVVFLSGLITPGLVICLSLP